MYLANILKLRRLKLAVVRLVRRRLTATLPFDLPPILEASASQPFESTVMANHWPGKLRRWLVNKLGRE